MQQMGHVFASPDAADRLHASGALQPGEPSETMIAAAQEDTAAPDIHGRENYQDFTTKAVLAKFHKTAQFNHLTHKDQTPTTMSVTYQYGTENRQWELGSDLHIVSDLEKFSASRYICLRIPGAAERTISLPHSVLATDVFRVTQPRSTDCMEPRRPPEKTISSRPGTAFLALCQYQETTRAS